MKSSLMRQVNRYGQLSMSSLIVLVLGVSFNQSMAKEVSNAKPVMQQEMPTLAQSSVQTSILVQVSAVELSIYQQPSAQSPVLFQAERSQLLTVVSIRGQWYEVDLSNNQQRTGWILNQKLDDGTFSLVELSAPGPVTVLNPLLVAGNEAILRPGKETSITLSTAPPIDPRQTDLPTASMPRDLISMPDRWRIMQALGFKFPLYDPFNQNVLKGDLPVLQNIAPNLFFNLGIVADSIYETRTSPTPVSQITAVRPGANNIYGNNRQSVFANTFIFELGLTKGNTTFEPPEFELRFVPAFQINRVNLAEAGALNINPQFGTMRDANSFGLQELLIDYHLRNVSARFDFDSLRVGIQPFNIDFRGFLYQDSNPGLRIFGIRDNNKIQYNLFAFQRMEKNTNTGLNEVSKPWRQDYVLGANAFYQDFPFVGITSGVSYTHNLNREGGQYFYDENGFLARPSFLGNVQSRNYGVHYFGFSGEGHLGVFSDKYRFNLSTTTYLALGRDDSNPFTGQAADIQAYFNAQEISYDFSWARVRGNFLVASGDKDPYDNKETGFDAIFENPKFAGSDSSYWIRQSVPLIGGGGIALSGRNGLLPSLRSSKEQGQSNFVNPGLSLLGLGADFDILPKLRLYANVSRLHFMEVASLAVLRNQKITSTDIGTDLSLGFHWRPYYNQNFLINGAVGQLRFGDAMKQLYGTSQDNLMFANLNLILKF